MLSIGRVSSMRNPSKGDAQRSRTKKLLGKPHWKVLAYAKLGSRASKLWRCVVPVLGWPMMNTGSDRGVTLSYCDLYKQVSIQDAIQLNVDSANKKRIR